MTTTENQAIKVRSSSLSSTWTYRGVTIHYSRTTKKSGKWSVVCYSPQTWFYLRGANKGEILEAIDRQLDDLGRVVERGRLITP